MQPTRRYWAVVALAAVLGTGALLTERAVLLAGAAGVGAWLLAHQYRYAREVAALEAGLTVDQVVTPRHVTTDSEATVTLDATADPVPLGVTVEAVPPAAVTGSTGADRTCRLAPLDREASRTFTATAGVAGSHEFEEPRIEVADEHGFLTSSFRRGPTPTLRVGAHAPGDLHVGSGGSRIGVAYGDHDSDRLGSGFEPAQVRRYVSGDAAARIDWKATARLGELFVREYEAETDRQTVLLVDHREHMAGGTAGRTKLEYAREVALGIAEYSRELNDPVGLYAVGDGGITGRYSPDAGEATFRRIRERLRTLTPTEAETMDTGRPSAPVTARRRAAALEDDDSAFGARLRPFLASGDAYVERIRTDPLFTTTRVHLSRLSGTVLTVVVTDDSRRPELREAVKLARRGDDAVVVFLTPSVLFESGGLADLERAYERYLEFEEFRRSLARLDRVRAYEVGPGDRLAAVLDGRRARRVRDREVSAP